MPPGLLTSGSWPAGHGSFTLRNCYSSGGGLRHFFYQTPYGLVETLDTTYLDGGAEFDGSPLCWMVSTTALASEFMPFVIPPLEIWSETIGAQTAAIEFVRSSATPLTDREIWSDIEYSATAGIGRYDYNDNRNNAPFTGTPVNQPASGATWTGSLGGSPSKQKLTHTITTAEQGLLQARVSVGKATELLFINPAITGIT